MSKTGKVIRKGKNFSIKEASADHPIYSRGFVVGGNYTKVSSKSTANKKVDPMIQEFLDNQLPQEVHEQMSGPYQPEKTDESGSSAGPDKKEPKS